MFSDLALRGCYLTSVPEWGMLLWTAGKRLGRSTFVWRVTSADTSADDIVSAMNYTNWWQGEPNDPATGNVCVELTSGKSYTWGDIACNIERCSVCELDLWAFRSLSYNYYIFMQCSELSILVIIFDVTVKQCKYIGLYSACSSSS